jgi:hypothetical protein
LPGYPFVVTATIDLNNVRKGRQNCDHSGHYAPPDVLLLTIKAQRQKLVLSKDRRMAINALLIDRRRQRAKNSFRNAG